MLCCSNKQPLNLRGQTHKSSFLILINMSLLDQLGAGLYLRSQAHGAVTFLNVFHGREKENPRRSLTGKEMLGLTPVSQTSHMGLQPQGDQETTPSREGGDRKCVVDN